MQGGFYLQFSYYQYSLNGWGYRESDQVFFSSEQGVVVVAIAYTIFFLIFVWLTTRSISLIDKKRFASEEALKKSYEALKKSESQLKELNATKDKFFNIVAHDLKNPFTSLLGSSELLFQNIDQLDREKIKTLETILNDSARGGYSILQNLLDWSRSQTGMLKINPERINLRNLIDENILNLDQFSANKHIKMQSEIKEDMFLNADKNMIKTILRNLLSNAVKFTSRSGTVIINAIMNSDEVVISVKDNGTGISEENIEKLFRIDTKYSMPGTDNE